MTQRILKAATLLVALLLTVQSSAQSLAESDLVAALREGGLVLVMRHTNAPRELPDAAIVQPDNVRGERQLDEQGRRDATLLGESLRRQQVVISAVLSSPTYRALETARLAGFDDVTVREELGNEGMREASAQRAEWLQMQVAVRPDKGNHLLITHGPNLNAAFPEHAAGMEEGDMLVFAPAAGKNGVVAIIKIGDWSAL